MTALEQYQRLECTGLWRERPGTQRQEVIIALGESSLVISGKGGLPLAHWSLPAVQRINAGERPALYRPGMDAEEELEVEDPSMIEGIETVRAAVLRRHAHPGRLRAGVILLTIAVLLAAALFWLPPAMVRYTASVVPDAKRADIGRDVLDHIHRVTGGECRAPGSESGLRALALRLGLNNVTRIAVLANSTRPTAHLPGGLILVNRALVEDFESADVLSGYVVAEARRAASVDPLLDVLEQVGFRATFQLLTTGDLPADALARYGEFLLTGSPEPIADAEILDAFSAAQIAATPYAYAVDMTGEKTVGLIEADPFADGGGPPLMRDADWVALQGICGA